MADYYTYDELALLQLVAKGDEQAFTILFNHHWDHLYNYMMRITKSHEISEEIVIDVFLKLWTGRELVADIQNMSGFLFKVAHNKAMDFLRQTAKNVRLQKIIAASMEQLSAPAADKKILDAETEKILNEAIEQLSPQRKLVYNLHRIECLSHEEIAERLNLSRQTVKNTMSDAIRSIRQYLGSKEALGVGILWVLMNL